jgi:hypothetical protein
MADTPNGSAANGSVETLNGVSEHSPLLPKPTGASSGSPDGVESTNDAGSGQDQTPRTYNKAQVILLSCCRMIDPITFFCIVPFVNQMIFDTGEIREEDVGFYSGLIVCRHPSVSVTTYYAGISFLAGSNVYHGALGKAQRPVRPEARARDIAVWHDLHLVLVRVQPKCLADDLAEVFGWPLLRVRRVGGPRFHPCLLPDRFTLL